MRILLVEPFYSGSHQQWADGYKKYSSHEIEILSLPGRHWKWRMHGAAPVLAQKCRSIQTPDLILVTDMLDLAVFKALLPKSWSQIQICLYFHENQLSYPWSENDPDTKINRDRHYAFINFTSALAADEVFFNSAYHLNSFIESLPEFLKAFPDHRPEYGILEIRQKSSVLPLGLELRKFYIAQKIKNEEKYILWNHRWEFDKNPELFFRTLFKLSEAGCTFRLIVCGENYGKYPEIFDEAKSKLASHIEHWGYVKNSDEYIKLLQKADFLPVSSIQDFFGISIAEAAAAGCELLLPWRLSYPEIFGDFAKFYDSEDSLYALLGAMLRQETSIKSDMNVKFFVNEFDWNKMAKRYDTRLEEVTPK